MEIGWQYTKLLQKLSGLLFLAHPVHHFPCNIVQQNSQSTFEYFKVFFTARCTGKRGLEIACRPFCFCFCFVYDVGRAMDASFDSTQTHLRHNDPQLHSNNSTNWGTAGGGGRHPRKTRVGVGTHCIFIQLYSPQGIANSSKAIQRRKVKHNRRQHVT